MSDRNRMNIDACRMALAILRQRREEMDFMPKTSTLAQRHDLDRAIELFEAFISLLVVNHKVTSRPPGIKRLGADS